MTTSETLERRQELFYSLDPQAHFNRLFDFLPGVHFFAKDRDGRILFANAGLARLYGYATEDEFIGRTDFEILPRRLAEQFRRDDVQVIETGAPLLGIIELFLSPEGIPDWYLTNKLPLRSPDGTVVGLMGTIQNHSDAVQREHPTLDIDRAVEYLRASYGENTPVSDLATMCNLSTRQFEAKFQDAFNTSPHQFRIRLRVRKACELLRNTDERVTSIATQTGFYDQSALAYHLKSVMGYTPLQYRKRYS